MNKLVTLRLKSMIYSGQDMGPDFRFAVSLGGKAVETGKRIRAGETRSFDEVILRVAVPESTSQLKLSIVVSESDPLYDDVGSAQSMIRVGGVRERKEHFLKIPVIGMGWEKKKRAALKIGLETEIESTLRYVKDVLPDGWLKVKLTQGRVEPHQGGNPYMSITRYARTWFRLGREGDRYLHVGDQSAGCITVLHKRKWTRICLFLLRSRKDSRTVGMLKVIR